MLRVYENFVYYAPAVIMFQYQSARCYGMLDIEQAPKMCIHSQYYADDDRIEETYYDALIAGSGWL